MRTANIGDLKNKLSAYLRYVRNGEEVIVCDRNVPIARIQPLETRPSLDPEEARLVAAGILKLPENPKTIDWNMFLGTDFSVMPGQSSVGLALESHDDVKTANANFDISKETMEKVSAHQ